MENHKRNNSLFSLEQGLFGDKISQQQSHQPSPKKRKQSQKVSQAFDFGEAIELRYSGDAFSTKTPAARSFSAPNSFASELEDESLPFEVEAFEVDKDVTPVSKPVTPQPETPVQPPIKSEVIAKPMQVEPVKATVVPPSEKPKSTRPVKQPTTVESTPPKEELSDAKAFTANLQAILNGEKTYDAEQKQVVPTSPPPPPPAPAPKPHPHDIFDKGQAAMPPQKPAEPQPVPMSRSHAVFDQMGKNMAHATNFDQGTVDLALEQRFDEFDRILDAEEGKPDNNQLMGQAMNRVENQAQSFAEEDDFKERDDVDELEEKYDSSQVIRSRVGRTGTAIHKYTEGTEGNPDIVRSGGIRGKGILTRVPFGKRIKVDWNREASDPNYVWVSYRDEDGNDYEGYMNRIHILENPGNLSKSRVIHSRKSQGAAIHNYNPGDRDTIKRGFESNKILTRVPVGEEIEVDWDIVASDPNYVWSRYQDENGNTYYGYINKDHILAKTPLEQAEQFTDKLKYPKLFEKFKAFTEQASSSESVCFIDDFKQLKASREDRDIVDQIRDLIELYISNDAEMMINISSQTRQPIEDAYSSLTDDKISIDNMIQALERANKKILQLLGSDTFERFKLSPEYKNLSF